MSRSDKHPLDNPLLPSEDEVLEFNTFLKMHRRDTKAFGYNRMLLAAQNLEEEFASLKTEVAAGLANLEEMLGALDDAEIGDEISEELQVRHAQQRTMMRILTLVEAVPWVRDEQYKYAQKGGM